MTPLPPSFDLLKIAGNLCRQRVPGQLIIQITDRCNATCPHCGMRVTSKFQRSDLPTDEIKRMIDAAAEKSVQALSFTGGEPLLRLDDLVALINYAADAGIPLIRTGTNGFFMQYTPSNNDRFIARVTTVAEKLAATPLRNFWISMDSSLPETHEKMRGLIGVVRGIEKALPIFHDHGLFPAVNLGINRNVGGFLTAELEPEAFENKTDYLTAFYHSYKTGLKRFYQRVISMGFTMLNTCYPMSIDDTCSSENQAVYAATATDRIVRFNQSEKALLFKVLMETVLEFRSDIRIFSPLTSLYTLRRHYDGTLPAQYPACGCRGGIDFFFVDAQNGDTYPCGYRGGDNMGKYWDLDLRNVDRQADCRRCDWECFRDPSEQFAPLMQTFSAPVRMFRRLLHDREYLRLWLADLRYYQACDFFDGRKPPRLNERMRNGATNPGTIKQKRNSPVREGV